MTDNLNISVGAKKTPGRRRKQAALDAKVTAQATASKKKNYQKKFKIIKLSDVGIEKYADLLEPIKQFEFSFDAKTYFQESSLDNYVLGHPIVVVKEKRKNWSGNYQIVSGYRQFQLLCSCRPMDSEVEVTELVGASHEFQEELAVLDAIAYPIVSLLNQSSVDRLAFACVHTPHFIKWIPLVFRKDNENENNKMSEKVHVMHILGYKSARFYEVIAQEKDPKNTISDQPEVTSQNTQENSLSQPDQSEDHESNGANKKESDPEDVDDT